MKRQQREGTQWVHKYKNTKQKGIMAQGIG